MKIVIRVALFFVSVGAFIVLFAVSALLLEDWRILPASHAHSMSLGYLIGGSALGLLAGSIVSLYVFIRQTHHIMLFAAALVAATLISVALLKSW